MTTQEQLRKEWIEEVLADIQAEIETCAIMTGIRKDKDSCLTCDYKTICEEIFEKLERSNKKPFVY